MFIKASLFRIQFTILIAIKKLNVVNSLPNDFLATEKINKIGVCVSRSTQEFLCAPVRKEIYMIYLRSHSPKEPAK